ncbi:MAG: U32 family peptidase, partial [Rhodospirillales bacterium]|nr:U32 family peptidase [Rhodospirillales bacterium]
DGPLIAANDVGILGMIEGRPHLIGPMVNVYNESTLAYLAGRGAQRVTVPAELSGDNITKLAPEAARLGVDLEVQVFGRLPLAISARCYHARAHGLHKDGCQYICAQDKDGLDVTTLDGEPFLAVNGTQTMSLPYHALLPELDRLVKAGLKRFRLWPHSVDMVAVAQLFRDVLDGKAEPFEAREALKAMIGAAGLANGFYYGKEGVAFTAE